MSTKKQYTPEVKAQVALEALSNQKTIAQLTSEYRVHQTIIVKWKRELKDKMAHGKQYCCCRPAVINFSSLFLAENYLNIRSH